MFRTIVFVAALTQGFGDPKSLLIIWLAPVLVALSSMQALSFPVVLLETKFLELELSFSMDLLMKSSNSSGGAGAGGEGTFTSDLPLICIGILGLLLDDEVGGNNFEAVLGGGGGNRDTKLFCFCDDVEPSKAESISLRCCSSE